MKSAHIYCSFPTTTFKARHRCLCFRRLQRPTPSPGEEGRRPCPRVRGVLPVLGAAFCSELPHRRCSARKQLLIRTHGFVSPFLKNAGARWKTVETALCSSSSAGCLPGRGSPGDGAVGGGSRAVGARCAWQSQRRSEPCPEPRGKAQRGFRVSPARRAPCAVLRRGQLQRALRLGGLRAPAGLCASEALHHALIFLAVLICFLFLCSTAKSWPFISFFSPLRVSCN